MLYNAEECGMIEQRRYFTMLIVLLFLGGTAAFFIAMGLSKTNHNDACNWFVGTAVMTWVVGAVAVAVLLISYPTSLGTISDLENFQERNYRFFLLAVEEFPDSAMVMTKEDTSTKKMLSYEYVVSVLQYNKELKWYRMYQNHWFLSPFIGMVSDDLEFIER